MEVPIAVPTVAGALPFEDYRECLARLAGEGIDASRLRPLAEAVSLLDITARVREGGEARLGEALDVLLTQTGSAKGAWYVADRAGAFRLAAARGGKAPATLPKEVADEPSTVGEDLDLVVPIRGRHGVAGMIAVQDERPSGRSERQAFVRAVAAAAALPLEGALLEDERQRLSRRLSVKVYQLRNLFELSRELTSTFDPETVKSLATATLMGHLMVSRAALYVRGAAGFDLALARGFRADPADNHIADDAECDVLGGEETAVRAVDVPRGALRDRLARLRMGLVAAVVSGGQCEALLFAGERGSGRGFSDEDCDFAATLARQTVGALQTVHLHQISLEKERQDRDLEIAREIQQTLFPRKLPKLRGLQIAARSVPCFRVGGDYYDVIALPEHRVLVAVADVSGKGTPASLLMASVHAWLRARAGSAPLDELVGGLNRFLCASTLANKFVTFSCAEIDAEARAVRYVNAGHIPPFIAGATEDSRLDEGGPALGLLEDAAYAMGTAALAPGDLMLIVTDGATEALSEGDAEFGDEGVLGALRRSREADADRVVSACFDEVMAWTGRRGLIDDLTLLAVKASE